MSNLPANASPSVLPVERLLPSPSPDATALVRLVTAPLSPPNPPKKGEEAQVPTPTVWILNSPHPLAGEAKIVRMYHREDGGVEVYSSDGRMFVRTVIPAHCVRFFDEAMSQDTFVEFISIAEEDEEEPEEPEDPEPDPEPLQEPNANGSAPTA